MVKVVFEDVHTAQEILKEGISIGRQGIEPQYVDMEKFTNVRVCMLCYSLDHISKSSSDFKFVLTVQVLNKDSISVATAIISV